MRETGRKRRIAVWVTLAVSVAAWAVFLVSLSREFGYSWSRTYEEASLGFGAGALSYHWMYSTDDHYPNRVYWAPVRPMTPTRIIVWSFSTKTQKILEIPLWPLVVVSTGLAASLGILEVRRTRRERIGRCRKCGYDHSGLPPGTKCPECGTTPSSAPFHGASRL